MCTFWNQLLWSNKFGPIYSKWLVSMATTQNLGCQKINTNLALSFSLCNIERHMTYQITALPEFYNMEFQNHLPWLPGCYGNQRSCQKSITLHFVCQIVNRHLCFWNQYQMCAYFTCFPGNISSCLMTLKCHLQSKVLSLLAEPPWSHHYLAVASKIYGVERQMRYQPNALKGFYQMTSWHLFSWLSGCHGILLLFMLP